jgi:hypothetical protein
MFVFDEKNLHHILSVAITNLTSSKAAHKKPVSANIIFLCARYAHYWNTPELLNELFKNAIMRIIEVIQVT